MIHLDHQQSTFVGKKQPHVFEKDSDVILWDTNAAGSLFFALVSNCDISIKCDSYYFHKPHLNTYQIYT